MLLFVGRLGCEVLNVSRLLLMSCIALLSCVGLMGVYSSFSSTGVFVGVPGMDSMEASHTDEG